MRFSLKSFLFFVFRWSDFFYCILLLPFLSLLFPPCVCGFLTACQVVMTVPPFFGQAERRALQDAGRLAGIAPFTPTLWS
jgi:hypothetical protein